MPGLTWDHTEDIALALHEKFPDLDPTHIRYTDLHQWITELEDFNDDPEGVDRRQAGSDPDGVAGRVSGQPRITTVFTRLLSRCVAANMEVEVIHVY